MERVSRVVFAAAALALMALAAGLVVYAVVVVATRTASLDDLGRGLLDGIGYLIIAIAVFDVSKFLVEEEVVFGRQLRNPAEARRSLTKFLSTIAIAVFLEALVGIFEAGKSDLTLMLYPTLLLLAGVALVLGLGVYQRLSASVEAEVGEDDRAADVEDERKKAGDEPAPVAPPKPARRRAPSKS